MLPICHKQCRSDVLDRQAQSWRKAVFKTECMLRRCGQGGSRRGLAREVMPTVLHVTRQYPEISCRPQLMHVSASRRPQQFPFVEPWFTRARPNLKHRRSTAVDSEASGLSAREQTITVNYGSTHWFGSRGTADAVADLEEPFEKKDLSASSVLRPCSSLEAVYLEGTATTHTAESHTRTCGSYRPAATLVNSIATITSD